MTLLWRKSTLHRCIPQTNGQWYGTLMCSLLFAYTSWWINNRIVGDGRRHDALVTSLLCVLWHTCICWSCFPSLQTVQSRCSRKSTMMPIQWAVRFLCVRSRDISKPQVCLIDLENGMQLVGIPKVPNFEVILITEHFNNWSRGFVTSWNHTVKGFVGICPSWPMRGRRPVTGIFVLTVSISCNCDFSSEIDIWYRLWTIPP